MSALAAINDFLDRFWDLLLDDGLPPRVEPDPIGTSRGPEDVFKCNRSPVSSHWRAPMMAVPIRLGGGNARHGYEGGYAEAWKREYGRVLAREERGK